MAAHEYPGMLDLVGSGAVRPGGLVTRIIGLSEVPGALAAMSTASTPGVTVIHPLAGRYGMHPAKPARPKAARP
jgi:threonine dehydrogenase-like Zn-dependent dehydrogenase